MKIYLASDHRGFVLKERLESWLSGEGYQVEDLGALEYQEDDDYPVYAKKVGESVRNDAGAKGVLFCGSGVGAVAAVNKIKGIVAAVGVDKDQVRAGRNDDDMNVLVLAADFIKEEEAQAMLRAFLETPFDKSKERYQRRIEQIRRMEEGLL